MLQRGSDYQLRRIVERFGDREHLAGVAIYDPNGKAACGQRPAWAATPTFRRKCSTKSRPLTPAPAGSPISPSCPSTPMPCRCTAISAGLAGVLVTFHDARYIEAQSVEIWRSAMWHVVAQLLLIVLITLLIVRSTIAGPINQTLAMDEGFAHRQAARAISRMHRPLIFCSRSPLKPRRSAKAWPKRAWRQSRKRACATPETRAGPPSGCAWACEKNCAATRCSWFRIASRITTSTAQKGIEVQVPASGLVTALEPILNACDGTWIAHGSADADRETVDEHDRLRVPPDQPHYTLRRVWLTKEEEDGYYFGFANEGIWPLCHIAHTRPSFRAADWEHYQRVNEKFAQAVLEEIESAEAAVRADPGLSLRAAAAADQGRAARRSRRDFLAHSLAQSGSLRDLPLAERTARRLAGRGPDRVSTFRRIATIFSKPWTRPSSAASSGNASP